MEYGGIFYPDKKKSKFIQNKDKMSSSKIKIKVSCPRYENKKVVPNKEIKVVPDMKIKRLFQKMSTKLSQMKQVQSYSGV